MLLPRHEIRGNTNLRAITKPELKAPFVSIVILNYNGLRFVKKCLESALKTDYDNFEVIFIDNASTDGSFEYVQKEFSHDHRLRIIRNQKNMGFAEGNNIGAETANGNYIAFLNIDTIVASSWLRELVNVMEADPKAGVCQSKLLSLKRPKFFDSAGDFIDRYGAMMRRGGDFMEKDVGQYDKMEEIFSARGAAMITRRKIIKEVGLFDPTYFATYEDIDFCWRTRLRGYKVLFVPNSVAYHVGGVSSPTSFKTFFTTRNWIMTLTKNYELHNLVRFLPFVIAISASVVAAELILRRRPKLALDRFKGVLWNALNFRYVWEKRLWIQRCIRKVPDSEIMKHMLKTNLAISHWLPLWQKMGVSD